MRSSELGSTWIPSNSWEKELPSSWGGSFPEVLLPQRWEHLKEVGSCLYCSCLVVSPSFVSSTIPEGARKYFFAQNQDVEPAFFCRELQEAQTPAEQVAELRHRSPCLSKREPAAGREAVTPDCQSSLILSMSGAQSLCSSQRHDIFNPLFGSILFQRGTRAWYLLLKSKPFLEFDVVAVITIADGGGLTQAGN